jgi:hypothetical protein
VAVIIVAPARLSELPVPKALGVVNLETIGFKALNHATHVICGDKNIIPIDAYRSQKGFDIFPG